MTVDNKTGAPKNKSKDMRKHEGIVKRLQQRIAKAIEENRQGKVKALTRLLVTSYSAKVLAVKTVTSNSGKHTAGVDGVVWKTKQDKAQAQQNLRSRGYKAQRLKRCYIKKKNGKLRPLSIPTMKDRAMQALYLQALYPIAEAQADPDSYGFRPGRSTHDAIEQIHKTLTGSGHRGHWILEGDIKACFDKISHDWLLEHVPMDKTVLKQWLKAGYLDQKKPFQTTEGTPQGGIASPVLCNLALDGMQTMIAKLALKAGTKAHFIRYADDFVVISYKKAFLLEVAKPALEDFLSVRGLELSEEKTLLTHINQGFTFLGKSIRKYSGKLIIKPSQESMQSILQKVKEVIQQHGGHVSVYKLKQLLNPRLRGWGNYHRFCCASKTFSKIDHTVFQMLYAWALRRHRSKGKRWVYRRYFLANHGFFNQSDKKSSQNPKLVKLSSLGIRRYTKVRKYANPFHPAWSDYFAKRQAGRIYRG